MSNISILVMISSIEPVKNSIVLWLWRSFVKLEKIWLIIIKKWFIIHTHSKTYVNNTNIKQLCHIITSDLKLSMTRTYILIGNNI